MTIGLGVGSTAIFAVQKIGLLLRSGDLRDIRGVPCSRTVEQHALELGIPLVTLEDHPVLDLTIDGADEVDPDMNLIKGGGGALLREKIVAQSSRREIIVVDEAKLSPRLGSLFAVPVEVVAFGWGPQQDFLISLGAQVVQRQTPQGAPYVTDQANLIFDCTFGPIADLHALSEQMTRRVGIVDHGLFLGLATDLIIAGDQGIRHLQRENANA
jgi:ribose 5-phosphate isomerase A